MKRDFLLAFVVLLVGSCSQGAFGQSEKEQQTYTYSCRWSYDTRAHPAKGKGKNRTLPVPATHETSVLELEFRTDNPLQLGAFTITYNGHRYRSDSKGV